MGAHLFERALAPRDIVGCDRVPDGQWTGSGVTLLQIEPELFDDHAELHQQISDLWPPQLNARLRARPFESVRQVVHATAVASIIKSNNFGIAPQVNYRFAAAPTEKPPATMLSNLKETQVWQPWSGLVDVLDRIRHGKLGKPLVKGDVISISLQADLGNGIRLPLDGVDEIREAINYISDERGVLVFIAAGNGKQNLDEFSYFERGFELRYRDSANYTSAIKVGYTDAGGTDTLLSNVGSMIPLFVPAESVLAACYSFQEDGRVGDLLDAKSGGFTRTSAATPMAASVAACLQGNLISRGKQPFTRAEFMEFIEVHADRVPNTNGRFPDLGKLASKLAG